MVVPHSTLVLAFQLTVEPCKLATEQAFAALEPAKQLALASIEQAALVVGGS